MSAGLISEFCLQNGSPLLKCVCVCVSDGGSRINAINCLPKQKYNNNNNNQHYKALEHTPTQTHRWPHTHTHTDSIITSSTFFVVSMIWRKQYFVQFITFYYKLL